MALQYTPWHRRFWRARPRATVIAGVAVIFAAGFVLGRFEGSTIVTPLNPLRESGYSYIRPLLLCSTDPTRPDNEDTGLERSVQKIIKQNSNANISFYMQELVSGGQWAGIGESQSYSPASMLKVPNMVAILKYADSHQDFLNKKIYYDGSFDNNRVETFKPQQAIQAGHWYTVDELLTYAVAYSDNNAEFLLSNSIDRETLDDLYINLGVQVPVNEGPVDFMSAKTYSLFLRILYNSTYLSRESSEKALGLMTKADFPQGIRAGVPSDIGVAQKFGEREVYSQDHTLQYRELHNCGIVYAPNNNYILCVMTRGQDFNQLSSAIQDVSKAVYSHEAGQ